MPQNKIKEAVLTLVIPETLDVFSCLGLKTPTILLEVGSASIFRWNMERGEPAKFFASEVQNKQYAYRKSPLNIVLTTVVLP
jgi:hypothetical protein